MNEVFMDYMRKFLLVFSMTSWFTVTA
jgi:hypothetical protein